VEVVHELTPHRAGPPDRVAPRPSPATGGAPVTILLIVALAWIGVLVVVLSLLTLGKWSDEAMDELSSLERPIRRIIE
jgi:hypothetical protein